MFFLRKPYHCPLKEDIPLATPIEELSYTIYDTETTGFQIGSVDRLIEIGAVHMKGFTVLEKQTFQTFVNPCRDIPESIMELTTITEEKVEDAPLAFEAIKRFFDYVEKNESNCLVGHYVQFDAMVLKQEVKREKLNLKPPRMIDTLDLIGYLSPSWDMRDLERYAMAFGTRIYDRHSAIGDALTTAYLFSELLQQAYDRNCKTWGDLIRATDNQSRQVSF